MGWKSIAVICSLVQLVKNKLCTVLKITQNHLRFKLLKHPFLELEICFRLTSSVNLCPYQWSSKRNQLTLSRNAGQILCWHVWRIQHLCYSLFVTSRSMWFLPGANIITQFISCLWIAIYATGSWVNAFYLFKLDDVSDAVNITLKVVFTYNPGGKLRLLRTP